MIAADRQQLEAKLRTDALLIREKELHVFLDNFGVLATLSSFLAGLGFSGLTMVPSWYNTANSPDEISAMETQVIARSPHTKDESPAAIQPESTQ